MIGCKFAGEGAELAFNRPTFDQADREGIVGTINAEGRNCLTAIGRYAKSPVHFVPILGAFAPLL